MEYILAMLVLLSAGAAEARIISSPRRGRLSLAERQQPSYYYSNINGNPGAYSFGFDTADQFRTEERYPNGTVVGSYGYVGSDGKPRRFSYIADERGYRVTQVKSSTPAPFSPPQMRDPDAQEVTWSRKKNKNKNKNKNSSRGKGTAKNPTIYRVDNMVQRPHYYSKIY